MSHKTSQTPHAIEQMLYHARHRLLLLRPRKLHPAMASAGHKHNIWGIRQEEGYYTYNDLKPQQLLAARND